MIYFWEQDTRLFSVAIVVPMGVLLPLEREKKERHVLPFTQDSRLTNRQPFAQSVSFLCLFNSFYLFIYLFHSYSLGYSLSHRRDSLQTLQETIGETFCYYYYILVVSIERNV